MGIFNKTEEEKRFNNLVKVIRSNCQNYDLVDYLVGYVSDVYNKRRSNLYGSFELLSDVILNLIEWEKLTLYNVKDVEEVVSFILPNGVETPDFEMLQNMIANHLSKPGGVLENYLFDSAFYTLFQNKYDYLAVMKMIIDECLTDHAELIFDYAIKVCPYCINYDSLKNSIFSFINGFMDVISDVDTYVNEQIDLAKRRVGIYPVDESTLAKISAEADRVNGLVKKLDALQMRVSAYEERVKAVTDEGRKLIDGEISKGKKNISNLAFNSVSDVKKYIDEYKKTISEELDAYLAILEENIKSSSDEVFKNILLEAQQKIREIKLAAQSLSQNTTRDLLTLQNTVEESTQKLKDYVNNEPEIRRLLNEAKSDDSLKEALMMFNKAKGVIKEEVVISEKPKENGRLIVPANPNVVIPSSLEVAQILPAFDENIPFDERINKILNDKKKREENGEIFHEMTDEIIIDVMEGDWVYLWGPSGCGKTHVVNQVASLLNIPMVECGKVTDKYSIIGYNDPQGNFRETPTYVAWAYGQLLFGDEWDVGNPDNQVILGTLYSSLLSALENPKMPIYTTFAEDMVTLLNPNFRIITAGNTSGKGENSIFSTRNRSDEAIQQRTRPKHLNYDNRVEERIFGSYKDWYGLFVNFRKACSDYAMKQGIDVPPGITTTRDAASLVKYIGHNSKSVSQILREVFVQTKDVNYLKFIQKQIKDMYGMKEVNANNFDNGVRLDEVKEQDLALRLVYECDKAIGGERR